MGEVTMRTGVMIATFVLLAPALVGVAAAQEPVPEATVYVPHAPITISGDGELAPGGVPNAAMGVVGGSGTADDPYLIKGWDIAASHSSVAPCAIKVSGTTKHLRIEANRAHDSGDDLGSWNFPGASTQANGICLYSVENVVVADNAIEGVSDAAILVRFSENVEIVGNEITGWVNRGMDISLLNSQSMRIVGNTVDRAERAVDYGGGALVMEDNVITNSGWAVEAMVHADQTYRGNVFQDNWRGVDTRALNLVFEENVVEGTYYDGLKVRGSDAEVHNNVFRDNGAGVHLTSDAGNPANGNVTDNWWSATDGPGGDVEGSGDGLLVRGGSTATYDPWLPADPGLQPGNDGAEPDVLSGTTGDLTDASDTADDDASCVLYGQCEGASDRGETLRGARMSVECGVLGYC